MNAKAEIGVGCIVEHDGHLLLGRRIAATGAGEWSFPGGKLDPGESPEDAAVRELEEETGLVADHAAPLGVWSYDVFNDEDRHFVTLYFIMHLDHENPANVVGPVNREPEKCEGWDWFPVEFLPTPLFAGIEHAVMWLG